MLLRLAGMQAKPLDEACADPWDLRKPKPGSRKPLFSIDRLQFFSRLKAHGLARRNRHFGAGARVASDAGLTRAHVKHAKSAQLDAIAVGQRLLHALKDGFHRQLSLGLSDAGSGHHFVDNVELNHERLPDAV